jgi:hypothetical protein
MGLVYQDRSFYALEVFVRPGGARESMVFVSSKIDDIKTALHYSLDYPDAIYLTVWYGREILLSVYQNGSRVQMINLLPYLTIQIPGFPLISFDFDGNIKGLFFSDALDKGDRESGFEVDTDDFIDLVTSDDFEFHFEVDWSSVPYPNLDGTLAMPGERVRIETSDTHENLPVAYGFTEFEDGPAKTDFDWEVDTEF